MEWHTHTWLLVKQSKKLFELPQVELRENFRRAKTKDKYSGKNKIQSERKIRDSRKLSPRYCKCTFHTMHFNSHDKKKKLQEVCISDGLQASLMAILFKPQISSNLCLRTSPSKQNRKNNSQPFVCLIFFLWLAFILDHFFFFPGLRRDVFSKLFIKLTGDTALNWALHRQWRLSHFRPEATVGWMRSDFALYLLNADWGFQEQGEQEKKKIMPWIKIGMNKRGQE